MAHVNLCEVMPGSSGTLTGEIVVVPGCSSDAISLLLGRAGANGPRQPRTNYVFKNCPVCVESIQKDLITSPTFKNMVVSVSSPPTYLYTLTSCQSLRLFGCSSDFHNSGFVPITASCLQGKGTTISTTKCSQNCACFLGFLRVL